ncbi:hypothetical protein O9993_22525 [Vibrio lentus]|nr:hypothetical protein [Vibrio lentus]
MNYCNHILYWNCMSQDGGGEPTGELGEAIKSTFGDFKAFQELFAQAAVLPLWFRLRYLASG